MKLFGKECSLCVMLCGALLWENKQGVIQKLRGQDEVGRWSVQCPRGQRVGSAPNVHESP